MTEGSGAVPPAPAGAPPPQTPKTIDPGAEIRRPDLQVLLQDLATAQRTLFEERRHADRRLAEERERSRWEQERIRIEMTGRLKDSERQNDVLVRTLGRFQSENERLREELAVLKVAKAESPAPRAEPPAAQPMPPPLGQGTLGVPGQPPRVPMVLAQEPPLGGTPVRLAEPPGVPPGMP